MGLDDDFGNQSERRGRGRVDWPLARITRKTNKKRERERCLDTKTPVDTFSSFALLTEYLCYFQG